MSTYFYEFFNEESLLDKEERLYWKGTAPITEETLAEEKKFIGSGEDVCLA